MQGSEQSLAFDDIEPHQQRAVYWGFLWRSLAMSLCGVVAAVVLSFLAGLMMGAVLLAIGVDPSERTTTLRLVGGAIGGALGLVAYWFWVEWMFRVKLAGYRLRLVPDARDATRQA